MARFEHMVFVCTNERDPNNPKGCCCRRGALEVLDRLKELTHVRGKKGKVRVTHSGCLDLCAKGVAVAVYSETEGGAIEETWYGGVTPADADALFESHLEGGKPLQRLVHGVVDRRL